MATMRSQPDTIIVVGTGYTGKELIRQASNSEYRLVGTSRDDRTLEFLEAQGAVGVRWSVGDDPAPWARHLGESTMVVYSIPTLFRDYQPGDSTKLARHIEPVDQVLNLCRQKGAARLVYLSSTSVYGDHGGEWVDETAELRPTAPYGKMRADIERHLMDADTEFPINIARLVGIYGPGRTMIDYIRSGRYTLVDGGRQVTNRVHVHDIARALLTMADRGSDQHRIYNITDGHPQSSRDLVEFICNKADIDLPRRESLEEYKQRRDDPNAIARRTNTVRVLNERLRTELDFSLSYPDAFTGYEALLENES